MAKWIIEQGGVVFGARWNEKWEVVHDYAEDIEGVKAFMRSKYVQSVVGDTLIQAKHFLDDGRWVMYSGTPCQLGGLRVYLGKEYEKLIQVDLICHGVPSPGVWRSYLKDFHIHKKVLDINFRDKKDGWYYNQCFQIKYPLGEYRISQENDPFFKGFLYDIYLRKSCYNCRFRLYHRKTDVTIGDYWGVDVKNTKVFDNKGTSVIFVHTKKGQSVINASLNKCIVEEQIKDHAVRRNLVVMKNIEEPAGRFMFFVLVRSLGFKRSLFAISTDGLRTRIKRKLKKIINRTFVSDIIK